ncbi:MAG: hypothetical protein KME57_35535 [Scytonema hyalinum WJT4-NPBG1]|nr:hypothetical protein [Scytonema hyalinum WJT4-NPBG1]
MANLRLISIFCNETEDFTGADEPKILVNGRQVWQGSLNDRQSASLTALPLIEFTSTAKIELYDRDSGGPDDDDFLGSHEARASEAGQGEKRPAFTGDGANYVITYEVRR